MSALHRSHEESTSSKQPRRRSVRRLLAAAAAPLLAVLVLTARPGPLSAQAPPDAPSARTLADSLEEGLTRAALRGDAERLEELRRLAERARAAHPDDPWIRHYLGYAHYRIGGSEMSKGGPEAADSTLERAQRVLERSAREDSLPESFALLAVTTGMRIGADPARRGATMGAKAERYFRAAEATGPDNPRVWLLEGINAFYTPASFGGGAEEARRLLEKAEDLFAEHEAETPEPGWGQAELHAYLGQVYARQGETERARAAFRTALEVAPGFAWVKERLLPAVEGGS